MRVLAMLLIMASESITGQDACMIFQYKFNQVKEATKTEVKFCEYILSKYDPGQYLYLVGVETEHDDAQMISFLFSQIVNVLLQLDNKVPTKTSHFVIIMISPSSFYPLPLRARIVRACYSLSLNDYDRAVCYLKKAVDENMRKIVLKLIKSKTR